jgi:hypothetical protein
MTVNIIFLHPQATYDHVGELPEFLSLSDPRPAKEQFNDNYRHGGGWNKMNGFTMRGITMFYPGDPPFQPIAKMELRDEIILIYEHSIVAIVQRDGSFEAARMD